MLSHHIKAGTYSNHKIMYQILNIIFSEKRVFVLDLSCGLSFEEFMASVSVEVVM